MKKSMLPFLSTTFMFLLTMPAFAGQAAKETTEVGDIETVDDETSPASSPKDTTAKVSLPAGAEKNSIAAVVNDDIISLLDIQERTQLIVATTGMGDSPEIQQKLKAQVVRSLIDERLQAQAAQRLNLTVSADEIQQAIAGIEKERGRPAGSLESYLRSKGVSPETFKEQIRAQISWSKLLGRKIAPHIVIADEEILKEQDRLKSSNVVQTQYQLATLLLPIMRPEDAEPTRQLAEKLSSEIRAGASFEAIASQLSAAGGKQSTPQWVSAARLELPLREALEKLGSKGVSQPVKGPSGYQILQLLDKREQKLEADTEVALRQLVLTLKNDAQSKEVNVLMDIAHSIAKHPGSCGETTVAGIESFEGLNIDVTETRTRYSAISPEVLPLIKPLNVGEISEPFAAPDGIHLVMLCEKIGLPTSAPEKERVRAQLFDEKLQLESMKYMRDLRREAFVDIRL